MDADVAIDAMMWQNGGMCGLDHWNFVMHPIDAAMTCDPYGNYVRKWCPELADLPDELIHKPWKCPSSMLRRAGKQCGLFVIDSFSSKMSLLVNMSCLSMPPSLFRCGIGSNIS